MPLDVVRTHRSTDAPTRPSVPSGVVLPGTHPVPPAPAGGSDVPDVVALGRRVVGWLRWLFAGQVVVVNLVRLDVVRIPWLVALATGAIVAWTVLLTWLDPLRGRRPRLVTGIDMLFTVVVILLTPVAIGMDPSGRVPLPVFWELLAPMAVAAWGGFGPGLVAGVVCGIAVGLTDPYFDAIEVALVLVNPLAAGAVGLMMDGVRQVVAERDRQQARAAAIAERERLNRIVHDGTLQVLALVEREGRTMGVRGERLAKLASQQEAKLRSLLQDRSIGPDYSPGRVDVVSMLDRHQSDVLTVSAMAEEVLLDADQARELDLLVAELTTNVLQHAGPDAHAWLLLEHEGDELVLWFRDDGVGMSPEQLDAARRRGRMGISGSVAGRMVALGGSAVVSSRPGRGVEWELRMPAPGA